MKKAFDSVWRDGLFYKLLNLGVGGKFFNVLQSMYLHVNYTVRLQNGLSSPFVSTCGVRQGCNLSPLLFNIFINDLPQCFADKCDAAILNSKSLNCLSWADDLALISLSKEGLQNCINNLESYCNKWKLRVNVSKTKVLVFTKVSINRLSNKFYIYGKEIQVTDSYTYLGIPLTSSGKFKAARKYLKTKAMRALFKLKSLLFSEKNIPIHLGMSLFNKFVLPILLYGAELTCFDQTSKTIKIIVSKQIPESSPKTVFSSFLNKLHLEGDLPATVRKSVSSDLTHTYVIHFKKRSDKDRLLRLASGMKLENDNFAIENIRLPSHISIPEFDTIDMNFQKFLLGVHAKSSNDGIRGELGTFPISINAQIQLIKYWHRLANLPEDSLLREAYDVVLSGEYDWTNHVTDILNYNGFGYVWTNPRLYHVNTLIDQLRLRLQDIYIQEWHSSIQSNSKLSIYSTLKERYRQKKYLSNVHNFELRRAITKIRICSHKLNIEAGRYSKIPRDLRFCPFCPNEIEDERHFVMDCSRYDDKRTELFTLLSTCSKDFATLCSIDKFKYILGGDNPHCVQVGKYIHDCLYRRTNSVNDMLDPLC